MRKKFEFKVTLVGYGENVDEAWSDAVSATDLESDPTPDDFQEYPDESDEDDEEED